MDLAEYKMQLEQLPYGKRLHTAVYLYHEPGTTFGQSIDSLLARIIERYQFKITPDFNVIKFRTDELKVSFLSYPDFISEAHTTSPNTIMQVPVRWNPGLFPLQQVDAQPLELLPRLRVLAQGQSCRAGGPV
jgi:hypothetical protein